MDPDKTMISFTIMERTVRRDFTNVPIKVLHRPGTIREVSVFPPRVNVVLKGRTDVVSNLNAQIIYAYVDLGTSDEDMSSDVAVVVPAPSGIEVVAVEPASVRVTAKEKTK
jgi:hypothetical protein